MQFLVEKTGAERHVRFLGFHGKFTFWASSQTFFSRLEAEKAVADHCGGLAVRVVERDVLSCF